MPEVELAKYGSTGVAIAAIAALVYIVIKFLGSYREQAELVKEMSDYLKLRNGKLDHTLIRMTSTLERVDRNQTRKAKLLEDISKTVQEIKTQNVNNQVVKHQTVEGHK